VARDLIERMGGGTFQDRLKTAEQKLAVNDLERASGLARDVLEETSGTPDEAEAGAQAYLILGSAFQRRGWLEEAALAYQTGLDRYPKAKDASEMLVRAIGCFADAQRAGRRKFYRDTIEELTNRLIRDYPKDPRVQDLVLLRAKNKEAEDEHEEAIKLYESILESSPHYTKARLMIGINYFNWAIQAQQDKDAAAQAPALYAKADAAFRKATTSIATAMDKTMDPQVRNALVEQDYISTLSLAKLLMVPAYGKMADATPVIDRLESKWGDDSAKGPDIQNLRGRWFLAQGKIEEAEKWVNDLYGRDKLAAAIPAGQVAAELDRMGLEKIEAKTDSIEGDDLWKRAARYYYWSIKPQVDGQVTQNPQYMTDVGGRFFIYGLRFNGVGETRVSPVDWVPGNRKAPDYFVKAAEIYEAALQQTPDYRMTINLGRTYGFLALLGAPARWVDCARVYAQLFAQEEIVNAKNRQKLDPAVSRAKPELVFAYLEWGVAERMAFTQDNDKSRLNRALQTILTPLANTVRADTSPQAFWGAKYHQVRALMDLGLYNDAKLTVEDVQRQVNPKFDDGEFGYKALFDETVEELKKK
jgi:tetratricopeptide (TPR) repeat protein